MPHDAANPGVAKLDSKKCQTEQATQKRIGKVMNLQVENEWKCYVIDIWHKEYISLTK